MNPIEHVWDAPGRRVAGRQQPPQTLQELERALLEEWDRIPQLMINSLIDPCLKDQRSSNFIDSWTVPVYPLGSWGGCSEARKDPDKLDLNRISGYKFPSSSTKGARRSFAPGARYELKSALLMKLLKP
ncbi:transposable element Tcb2 transposase [Trichonephila clavipes]|nr:transposable element Tcb2 transposase [Trichonephila clavipes]